MHLAVFARRSVNKATDPDTGYPAVNCARSGCLATGFAGVLGNKGCVAACLKLFGTSVAFVSAHLAAHESNVHQRNEMYHKISTDLALDCHTPSRAPAGTPLEGRFDCVVFMGDLNYRINGGRAMVERLIKSQRRPVLRNNDQLREEMTHGRAFSGYSEAKLDFDPTYKFNAGTSDYDTSAKRRVPAWTDRVLFTSVHTTLQVDTYGSHHTMISSDHKPVYAGLRLLVRCGEDWAAEQATTESDADGAEEREGGEASSALCTIM